MGSFKEPSKFVFSLLGAALLTFVLYGFEFDYFEARHYDLRMAWSPKPALDVPIVLVSIDEATTSALQEVSPLPLKQHSNFLANIARLKPRAVGYLVDLKQASDLSGSHATEDAQEFQNQVDALKEANSTFLIGTPFGATGETVPPKGLSSLPRAIAMIHKDGNLFGEDKVTRRALTHLYNKRTFHWELAHRLGELSNHEKLPGEYEIPEINASYFFFRYYGDTQLSSPERYPRYTFNQILENKLPDGALEGKIVLVGTINRQDTLDFTYTPYSRASFVNPKLFIHGMILESILKKEGIRPVSLYGNAIVTLVLVTLILFAVFFLSPLKALMASMGLVAIFFLTTHALFQWSDIWLRSSQTVIGMALAYYLTVPFRLIREYQKRFAYQRQNELLMQVEELKTNFLHLVTHDLKTPVARIQGLAEVILRKSQDRLMEKDQESLLHIIRSTEELNRFISSILELQKVESNRLQITFQSRDINQIIEKLVVDFRPQAKAKKIQVETKLDTLFPIRVDANLISKVISNLIDNAIKYSSPHSTVYIESAEAGDDVCITVRDQGEGMSQDELSQLFTKFYRAKTSTESKISGSGLGLYLTKYFVEAHRGRVEVESQSGVGSTFKIFLPQKLPEFGKVETGLRTSIFQSGIRLFWRRS